MNDNNTFVTPPANEDDMRQNYEVQISQLRQQTNEMIKVLNTLSQAIQQTPVTAKPATDTFSNYCQTNPAATNFHVNEDSVRPHMKTYSSDFENTVNENMQLRAENQSLQETLNMQKTIFSQREQAIDLLTWNDDGFHPGQVNRNIMWETMNHQYSAPIRLRIKYPIQCNCCGATIFKAADAYDDLYPTGSYERGDIFCKKCFLDEVVPQRISRTKELIDRRKNASR